MRKDCGLGKEVCQVPASKLIGKSYCLIVGSLYCHHIIIQVLISGTGNLKRALRWVK